MAVSLISSLSTLPSSSSSSSSPSRHGCPSVQSLPSSSFLRGTELFHEQPSSRLALSRRRRTSARRCYVPPSAKSMDHIPKQFREENLKDGLMDNYRNLPKSLYGLSPSQMNMFMTEDNPARRQAETVTEESISSAYNYANKGGMWSLMGMDDDSAAKYSMSVSMYRGGARGGGRRRRAPPDLPSLLLDARICYLGMPIVPAVTELIVGQFIWLDFDDATKPIYLYINSPGSQNDKMECVGSETDAFALADMMSYVKAEVYTVNCGMAYGTAAMLLAHGAKGHRAVQPHSSTKLYLPQVARSSGTAVDMWIRAKELDANADSYVEILANGCGKSKEEVFQDIQEPLYLHGQDAIDYGVADKILTSNDKAFEKRDYNKMLAQARAMRAARANDQTATLN